MLEYFALAAVALGFGAEFGFGAGLGAAGAAYLLVPPTGEGRGRAIERVAREVQQLRELLEKKL